MINSRKSALFAMVITALLWSLGGVLIKLVDGNPLGIASGRAGLSLLPMLIYSRFKFEKLSRNIVVSALLYCFTVIGFVVATKLTTAANAIFLQFTAPIWVVIFSRTYLKLRVKSLDIITILVMTGGMFLFFIGKLDQGMFLGNVIALLTGVSFAGFIVSLKTIKKGKTLYPILYGNILAFVIGIPFYTSALLHINSIVGLLLLGLLQVSLAYILYALAIEHLSAVDGIIMTILEPLLNPIWVAFTIGETPSLYALLGGVIILMAMVVRNVYQVKGSTKVLSG